MNFKLTIMTLIALAVNAWTPMAHAESAKNAGKSAKGKGKGKDAPAVISSPTFSNHYVHQWINFPNLQGRSLHSGEPFQYAPRPGRSVLAVFIASWCLPCQEMLKPLKQLEAKFASRYTDFVYIFAHDTEPDALGFSKVYGLGDNAIIGSAPLLEAFHQPELPSIYIGDRYGWLLMRKLNTQLDDLKEIDRLLELQTAF